MKLVLSYPSSKFLAWQDPIPILELGSKILSASAESDRTSVVVELSSSFYLEDPGRPNEKTNLWVKTQRVVFARFRDADVFVLDAKRSQLSSAERKAIYDDEVPTNSELLRYDFVELQRLATGTNEIGKAWLRSYLAQCKNTAERERLVKTLSQ